jgi:hypothetical protein
LHIPQMDHNLITSFILWEAGLKVNGEEKLHTHEPTIDHHSIYGGETKLQIHLQLKGVFSYFPTCALTIEEQDNWEDYEVIFLTPDAANWDLNSEHFAQMEDSFLDADGDIAICDVKTPTQIITDANIGSLYAEPLHWDRYEEIVDEQFQISCLDSGAPFDDDEAYKLNQDPIRAHLSDVGGVYKPEVFAAKLNNIV